MAGLTPLEREVERSAREDLARRATEFAGQLPGRVRDWLQDRTAVLTQLAARVSMLLPLEGAAAFARLEREGDAALCVRAANGAAVFPAGTTDVRLVDLPEWSRFEALARRDAAELRAEAAWQQLEAAALRARLVAMAFSDSPDAGVEHVPALGAAQLAVAGPLVVEWLGRSAVGRERLAAAPEALVAVAGTEVGRLGWLRALGADAATLARQELRARREQGADVFVLRAALPGGAELERLLDIGDACASFAVVSDAIACACAPAAAAPRAADADTVQVVVGTALGELTVAAAHRDLPALRVASGRRRWLTGGGIVSLTVLIATGIVLVRRTLLREAELRELRDQFLANVSHDLKTPLTSLRLHAEMLTAASLDDATRARYAAVVDAEGARMSALIEDLLDVSALQQGRRRIEPEPVDLAAAVRAATAAWRPLVERDGVALRCRADAEVPALADPIALGRILTNLLQNALRHGRPARDGGAPWIELAAGPGPSLRVRDNGPGVPAVMRERIFGRFVRGRDGGEGLGLGLALSRELATACGGTLRCGDDGATVFELSLPAVVAPEDEA